MKLIILKELLKQGIGTVERIGTKSFNLPILSNVLMTAEKNFLKLSTTDLELGVNWWSLVKVEKEGSIAIPGKTLSSFVGSLPNKQINLETRDSLLKINCDNYQTSLKGFNSEEFPIIPKIQEGETVLVNSQKFCHSLGQVVDFASFSTTRPEISGIYISFKNKLITFAATDSFRLGEKNLAIPPQQNLTKDYSIILPQKSAKEIINIFGEEEGDLKIYLNPNQIMFETNLKEISHPHIQLVSRLIEGEFPNYQEIIPKKFETKITLPKNEFISQIKLASLFSGKVNEVKIKVDPKQKRIDLLSQNSELGDHKSFLSSQIEGKELELSFNHKFLIDGLSHIENNEVIFELRDSDGPAILKAKNNEDYLYLVMPIRTG